MAVDEVHQHGRLAGGDRVRGCLVEFLERHETALSAALQNGLPELHAGGPGDVVVGGRHEAGERDPGPQPVAYGVGAMSVSSRRTGTRGCVAEDVPSWGACRWTAPMAPPSSRWTSWCLPSLTTVIDWAARRMERTRSAGVGRVGWLLGVRIRCSRAVSVRAGVKDGREGGREGGRGSARGRGDERDAESERGNSLVRHA